MADINRKESSSRTDYPWSKSEEELGQKWDRCIADTSIKIAGGIGLGIVFSVIFFKRRPWPIAFGTGVGLGMGYSNCQHDFESPYIFHGEIKHLIKKKTEEIMGNAKTSSAEVSKESDS